MANRLQNPYFLLQSIRLRSSAVPMSLLEPFHRILHACAVFKTKIDSCKMALAERLRYPVLLSEGAALSVSRVVEEKSCLIKDRDFIRVLELSALVPPHNGLVDESAIA